MRPASMAIQPSVTANHQPEQIRKSIVPLSNGVSQAPPPPPLPPPAAPTSATNTLKCKIDHFMYTTSN